MDDLSFRSPRPRRRCDASTQIMLLSLRVPRGLLTGGVGLLLVMSIGCSKRAVSRRPSVPVPSAATQRLAPAQSTFFSTAAEESYSTYQLAGDGDLWPSCWADDDNLYTANGDGKAFNGGSRLYDMAVSLVSGMPPNLSGRTLATDVGTNWSGRHYNRKPTGMLCVDGAIYLAFQNLQKRHFDDAPAASIAKSTDHGVTWTWDRTAPMFGASRRASDPAAHKFTTIFFLDYGRNYGNAIDGFVYAYGLDNNWRDQQDLYLARAPRRSILDRRAWEFFAGVDSSGVPAWSSDIGNKKPALTDNRSLYPVVFGHGCPHKQHVIAQGGVVYDAPLHRYIFASWSCATQQFYEAANPWGPWNLFLSDDFGPLRLPHNYGQYGTSIPSKFISTDGLTLYLQSNVWVHAYTFSLRKLYLQTYSPVGPANHLSDVDLTLAPGARAISKSTHFGSLCALNCADQISGSNGNKSEDDFDEETKTTDWWGYIWPQTYTINTVIYRTGSMFPRGGWYARNLRVQVRQDFRWIDVPEVTISPSYPYDRRAGDYSTYTFTFKAVSGDGVRIIGTPGGDSHFTSISHLAVYFTQRGPL